VAGLLEADVPGFIILGECGRGGMGIVCLAEQAGLGRRVAIKFLKRDLADSDAQRSRFRNEAKALACLQHPNIVQVFDTGEHAGRLFIVQEFVGGGSLDQRLDGLPQDARHSAKLLIILAQAVQHAHDRHVIHRDLKPANVLLDGDECPKISDFGLAKQLGDEESSTRTESGTILGSPSYMAPEQVIGQKAQIGPSVDVYALGAILYQMLTGRPPFLAASMYETLTQVRTVDCVPPRRLRPSLPPDLETICLKCLAKPASQRYLTAAALADDLERFLNGRPIRARPASVPEHFGKWVRRRPATAAGFGVACIAVMALLVGGMIYQGLLRAALERAIANERRADQRYRVASESMQRMVDRSRDPRFARTPRLRELLKVQLDDALRFYREVMRDRDDPAPAVRFEFARASFQAATIQEQLDCVEESYESVLLAIRLLEPLVQGTAPRADYRFTLAQSYRLRGRLGDRTTAAIERTNRARQDLERVIAMLEPLVVAEPSQITYRSELAAAYHDLGTLFWTLKQSELGEQHFRRAIELDLTLLDSTPSLRDANARIHLADTRRNLAVVTQSKGEIEEASRQYSASRDLLLDVLLVDPDQTEASLALAGTLYSWAIFLSHQPNDFNRTQELFGEAIERLSTILKREPEWGRARMELLNAHGGRAQWLDASNQFAASVLDWEKVVALADPESKMHHRCFLAAAFARAGDHRRAWEQVQILKPQVKSRPPDYSLYLGAVCSLVAALAESDQKLSKADGKSLTITYAKQGIDFLKQALELTPEAGRASVRESFQNDVDLTFLRKLSLWADLRTAATAPVNAASERAPRDNK
jgi:eukaryotic-like serine/threonine-protein kinase